MDLASYISRVFRFAIRDFAIRTDLTYGLVSLIGAIIAGPESKPVLEVTTYDVGVYAAYTLGFYLLIRLIFVGPFMLCREEYEKSIQWQEQADSPKRIEKEAFKSLKAAKRMKFIKQIRLAHVNSVEGKEQEMVAALKQLTILEPQAVDDASLHDDVREFMRLARETYDSEEKDFSAIKNASEKLMQAVHAL